MPRSIGSHRRVSQLAEADAPEKYDALSHAACARKLCVQPLFSSMIAMSLADLVWASALSAASSTGPSEASLLTTFGRCLWSSLNSSTSSADSSSLSDSVHLFPNAASERHKSGFVEEGGILDSRIKRPS